LYQHAVISTDKTTAMTPMIGDMNLRTPSEGFTSIEVRLYGIEVIAFQVIIL
jgi:hypothetical protein